MAQGLGLRSPPEVAEDAGDAVELKARLQKMVIKTYGRGFGGFGSAGAKSARQLPAGQPGFMLTDGIDIGSANRIPLFLVGFLY